MRGEGEQKWREGWGAVFKVGDLLESYDLAGLLAELFLLADSEPSRHFCSPFLPIGYLQVVFDWIGWPVVEKYNENVHESHHLFANLNDCDHKRAEGVR